MQTIALLSSFFFLSMGTTSPAGDLAQLESIIQTYNKAGATNDISLLEPILHEHFRVIVNDPGKQVCIYFGSGYLSGPTFKESFWGPGAEHDY